MYGGEDNCIQVFVFLVGKPEGKRPLRRRHILDDTIKMDFKEMGWHGDVGWIDLAQDRDQ
jgi:hypothetical protein